MESVKNLLEILKSQELLYLDMVQILESEKDSAVTWDSEKTIELVKKKDTLAYKEKILDEAFVKSIRKIEKETGREGLKVETIAKELGGEYAQELSEIRLRLMKLLGKISELNTSLKILYKTNISLIESVFGRLGIAGKQTYGINKDYRTSKTSTISKTG